MSNGTWTSKHLPTVILTCPVTSHKARNSLQVGYMGIYTGRTSGPLPSFKNKQITTFLIFLKENVQNSLHKNLLFYRLFLGLSLCSSYSPRNKTFQDFSCIINYVFFGVQSHIIFNQVGNNFLWEIYQHLLSVLGLNKIITFMQYYDVTNKMLLKR